MILCTYQCESCGPPGWPKEFWKRKSLYVRILTLPLAFTARIPSKIIYISTICNVRIISERIAVVRMPSMVSQNPVICQPPLVHHSQTKSCFITAYIYIFFIITSVLRLLHRMCVHCYTYRTTFMHFRYLQLDIFTLINIIYLKHIICNSMTLSSTPLTLPPFPTSPPLFLPLTVSWLYFFIP